MDMLNPSIVKVGGRRYRKMHHSSERSNGETSKEQMFCADRYLEDEPCDDGDTLSIVKTDRGYTAYCDDIPSYFFKFICGRKQENIFRIERETKTQIRLPKPGIEGEIVIYGNDRRSVLSAKSRIDIVVESSRSKLKPTHFISIPLVCDSTIRQFEEFEKVFLEECAECKGFDEELIQDVKRLHLTMGVMTLMNDREIGMAAEFLTKLQDDIKRIIGDKPMKIILEGIESMNDDPSASIVLYAKVKLADGTDRLQRMANFIKDQFTSSGIMKNEFGPNVKLHATVINTGFLLKGKIYESNQTGPGARNYRNPPRQKKPTFDARKLFQVCDNFNFGEVDFKSIHLSQMSVAGQEGYYHCEASIDL